MSLYTVNTGNTINAADLNQVVNVLQVPSGGTEAGQYFLAGPVYTSAAVVALFMPSRSRGATPVSVAVDTSLLSPTGGMSGTPSTNGLGTAGFQIFSLSTTGPNPNARCAGAWTIQY